MANKVVSFNDCILATDGSEYQDKASKSKILSALLGRTGAKEVNDILKIGGWIEQLNKNGKLDLDEADINKLKDTIKDSDFDAWSKYQLLKSIEDAPNTKVK